MTTQGIDLSPLEVLKRFRDMEPRLPHRDFELYYPTLRFFINNDDDYAQTCQVEAENMINFAGLVGYTPSINFKSMEGAAGNINLNGSHQVQINLDESLRDDFQGVMATLAHEISHKVLYNSNLYYTDSLMQLENEVLADLATFYLGFGNLMMSGFYRKTGNQEHRRGYLTPRTYGIAYIISCKMNGKDSSGYDLPAHAKQAIAEASFLFPKDFFFERLGESSINESFVAAAKSASLTIQKLDYLTELLKRQRSSVIEYEEKLNKLFYNNPLLSTKTPQATPYMALAARHLLMKDCDLYKQRWIDEKLGTELDTMIQEMAFQLEQKGVKQAEIEQKLFSCPFCGFVSKGNRTEEKAYHLICPSCKSHFVVNVNQKAAEHKDTSSQASEEDEETPEIITEYVYIGMGYGDVKQISRGKRIRLFLDSLKKAWSCLIMGKN